MRLRVDRHGNLFRYKEWAELLRPGRPGQEEASRVIPIFDIILRGK